jgi:hypothetical protein
MNNEQLRIKNMKQTFSIFNFQLSILLLALLLALPGCKDDDNGGGGDTPATKTIRYRGIHMYNGMSSYGKSPEEAPWEMPVPDDEIDKVGEWGANFTRWQLYWWDMPATTTAAQYHQFIVGQCDILDTKIPVFARNGIKVCLAMFAKPGGRPEGQADKIFTDEAWENVFVEEWEYIATRYKDSETVVMYDLMNEPYPGGSTETHRLIARRVFVRTAQAIRAIDPNTEIVYEEPDGFFFENSEPFDIPGIVYSTHVYAPLLLTHQSVISTMPLDKVYPGIIDNVYWDATELRYQYRTVRQFANKYNVRILIGEFSCVRWAPNNSAYNYIKDCIEWFEEEGWDWIYFSLQPRVIDYGGANSWSVEHDTNVRSSPASARETDREKLLKSYFQKNNK